MSLVTVSGANSYQDVLHKKKIMYLQLHCNYMQEIKDLGGLKPTEIVLHKIVDFGRHSLDR